MATKFTKSVAFAKQIGKTILFPGGSKFSDFFESVDSGKKIVAVMVSTFSSTGRKQNDSQKISNFVSITKAAKVKKEYPHSFYATPKKDVLAAMDKNMIVVNYDEIYFQISVRSATEALVLAKHNQIIGDRWLGFIDPKTIPTVSE